MSYTKNIISNFYTRILKIILGFGTSVIIARSFGPEGKGYVTYFLLIFSMVANYSHLGINNATSYFYKKTKYKGKDIYNTNLSYLFLIWIIVSIIFIILKYYKIVLIDYSWLILFSGLLYILFTFMNVSIGGIFIGDERIVEINNYYILNNIFVFLATIISWYFNFLNIVLYLWYVVIGLFINNIFFLRNINFRFSFKLNRMLLKEEFKYGISIYFSALFIFLNYRVDQLLIKKLLGMNQLGLYSVGVQLAELLFLIPQSVTTALEGKLYNMPQNDNRKTVTALTIKYTFFIAFCLAMLGIIMTPLVPIIYGTEYKDSVSIIIVLFIGVIFASIGKVSPSYFFTQGRPRVHLIITFITLIVNVTLNVFLIPINGIIGAAYASTIAYIIYGLTYVFYFVMFEKFSLQNLLLLNKDDFTFLKRLVNKYK